MMLTLWNKRELSMLELTLSSANFQLPHWAPNCCCSEHIVLQYMAVSFGAPCSSTHIVSLMLHITMFSDNCYKNLDGVVHLNSLCLIMCLHSLPIFTSLYIHCIAHSESLTMFSYKLHWTVMCVLFRHYFVDGVTCYFNLLLCVLIFYISIIIIIIISIRTKKYEHWKTINTTIQTLTKCRKRIKCKKKKRKNEGKKLLAQYTHIRSSLLKHHH